MTLLLLLLVLVPLLVMLAVISPLVVVVVVVAVELLIAGSCCNCSQTVVVETGEVFPGVKDACTAAAGDGKTRGLGSSLLLSFRRLNG